MEKLSIVYHVILEKVWNIGNVWTHKNSVCHPILYICWESVLMLLNFYIVMFSLLFVCGKHFDSVQPMPSLYIGLA